VLLELTIEQFTQQVAGSYGSIRNTMVHMLSAEWDWLERCGGAARGPALNARNISTLFRHRVIKQARQPAGTRRRTR
jgi:uncharacterized damage-inducible protein DinB